MAGDRATMAAPSSSGPAGSDWGPQPASAQARPTTRKHECVANTRRSRSVVILGHPFAARRLRASITAHPIMLFYVLQLQCRKRWLDDRMSFQSTDTAAYRCGLAVIWLVTTISTRRLLARPSGDEFSANGR